MSQRDKDPSLLKVISAGQSLRVRSIYVASPATSPANSVTLTYVTKIQSVVGDALSISDNNGDAGDTDFAGLMESALNFAARHGQC